MTTKSNGWKVTLTVLAVAIASLGLIWGVTDKKVNDKCGANTQRIARVEQEQDECQETNTQILQAIARVETSQHHMREDIREIKEDLRGP